MTDKKRKTQTGERKLTEKQSRFIDEYLIDLNGKAAAIRAGYAEKTAAEQAYQMLNTEHVKEELGRRKKAIQEAFQIEQKEVLKRWYDIATADPNDLTENRRGCCRYCWGEDHQYQWRTEREYAEACTEAAADEKPEPSDDGGYGYNAVKKPNPECPECDGEGVPRVIIKDTSSLPPKAKLLYKGVKRTKDGVEVLMHDQMAAWNNIAKHLGMFVEKVEIDHGVSDDVLEKMAEIENRSRMQSIALAEKLEARKGGE